MDPKATREEIQSWIKTFNRLENELIAEGKIKRRSFSQREEDVYNSEPLKNILEEAGYENFKKAT